MHYFITRADGVIELREDSNPLEAGAAEVTIDQVLALNAGILTFDFANGVPTFTNV